MAANEDEGKLDVGQQWFRFYTIIVSVYEMRSKESINRGAHFFVWRRGSGTSAGEATVTTWREFIELK